MGKRHFDENGNPKLDAIVRDICGFYHHHAYERAQGLIGRSSKTPKNEYEREEYEAAFMAKMVRDFQQIPVRGIYIFGSQGPCVLISLWS